MLLAMIDALERLDALVAAPEHHHLLIENEHVRVLETLIAAGQRTAVHTHRWPSVQYVVSSSDFVRRDGDGTVIVDTRTGSGPPKPSSAFGPVRSRPTPSRTSVRPSFA
jgi:hypothetical protein